MCVIICYFPPYTQSRAVGKQDDLHPERKF